MFTAKQLKSKSSAAWNGRKNSGASILQLTIDMLDHAFGESGDWTPLAHHIAKGKAVGADREVSNIQLVVRKLAPGIVMQKDEKQPSGIRINLKKAVKSNEARAIVSDLIERKVSITGTAIKAALTADEEKKQQDVSVEQATAQFKRAMSKMKAAGMDKEKAMRILEALYNGA